jgi:hypothetical protein
MVHDAPFGDNDDLEDDFEKHIKSISDSWLLLPWDTAILTAIAGSTLPDTSLKRRAGKPFPKYLGVKVLKPLKMAVFVQMRTPTVRKGTLSGLKKRLTD